MSLSILFRIDESQGCASTTDGKFAITALFAMSTTGAPSGTSIP